MHFFLIIRERKGSENAAVHEFQYKCVAILSEYNIEVQTSQCSGNALYHKFFASHYRNIKITIQLKKN